MAASDLEVDCPTVKQMLDAGTPFLLLDCREQDEHAFVHLPQAMLLPMSELAQRVEELQSHRDEEIVVHCHHGGRSLRVAMWLRQQGFARAKSMSGGIDEWAVRIDSTLPRY